MTARGVHSAQQRRRRGNQRGSRIMAVRFDGGVSYHIGGGAGTETPNPLSDAPAFVIHDTDIPRLAVGDLNLVEFHFNV